MTRSPTARILSPLTAATRLPLTAVFAVKVAALITQWDHRHRSRNALRTLDDYMLEDVGLTRAQAHKEAQRPFWLP